MIALDVEAIVKETPGLIYSSDDETGYTRKKRGTGFSYYNPRGVLVTNKRLKKRFQALGIPPAYSNVWICKRSNGHLQATGLNDAGKKQYLYHPKWEAARDNYKFMHMKCFAGVLPTVRQWVKTHLQQQAVSEERVVAACIRLMDKYHLRVGNSVSAQHNNAYGVTTLRKKHVTEVNEEVYCLEFQGKSGQDWELVIENDPDLIRTVQHCESLPGYTLFQYLDDEGNKRCIDAATVNQYLQTITGTDITAKDFRTWAGTVQAVEALESFTPPLTQACAKRHVAQAVRKVANALGNTPSVCRKAYIHPNVLQRYLEGTLPDVSEATGRPYFSKIEAHTLLLLEHDFAKATTRVY